MINPVDVEVKIGDIFFTSSNEYISRSIEKYTTSRHENISLVSHVGLIVSTSPKQRGGLLGTVLIDSRWNGGVVYRQFVPSDDSTTVGIYRPKLIPDEIKVKIISHATNNFGKGYGSIKIAGYLLDGIISKVFTSKPEVFKRFFYSKKFPVCSNLVSDAFLSQGFSFGTDWKATPDDIWDFVVERSDLYEEVLTLQPLLVKEINLID